MTKAEFIENVQSMSGEMSKAEIGRALDATANIWLERLADGGRIDLLGLGSLKVVQRQARIGRNPRTGKAITIPAKSAAKFVPGKAIKDALKGVKHEL